MTRNNFRKPDLFTTAEDVSQAVEVLWVDNSRNGNFNNNIKKSHTTIMGQLSFPT